MEDYKKKYEEAINRAKDYTNGKYPDALKSTQAAVELIFPELKESEDERTSKAIIDIVKSQKEQQCHIDGAIFDKMIDWLEKQGTSYTKKDVDDAYLKGMSDAKNEIEKQYEANYQIRKDIATFIFNHRCYIKDRAKWMDYLGIKASFVEKQGDKPQGKSALEAIKEEKVDNANKVEPKFKVGNWVVQKDLGIYKIVEICESWYEVISYNDGIQYSIGFDKESDCRLWTIQDAKPGDVLVDGNLPFIFKKADSYNYSYAYCGMSVDSSFKIESEGDLGEWTWNQEVTPATKEQRETLFKAMHEANYEWDAEKKELKKIEEKSADWLQELEDKLANATPKQLAEWKEKYFNEKPAEWNEDDEEKFRDVVRLIEQGAPVQSMRDHYTNWLKSLKERVQPQSKQEWSEEDEKIFGIALDIVAWYDDVHEDKAKTVRKWLKSIKDRVQPREWSEEDEYCRHQLITLCESCVQDDDAKKCANWLKSLKPRSYWKPSKQQMTELYATFHKAYFNTEVLHDLYNDLTKL